MNFKAKIEVREVNLNDYNNLIIFLNDFDTTKLGKQYWSSKINYWWEDNPSFHHDSIRGALIIELEKNKIIGFLGVVPITLSYNGLNNKSYFFTTWRVQEKFKNHSMKLLFFLLPKLKDNILFNYTANETAHLIYKSLKFESINETQKIKSYIYFLEPFLKNTFKNRYLTPLFFLSNFFRKAIQFNRTSNYIIKPITNMNDIDKLWSLTSNDYKLTFKRNSSSINWIKTNKHKVKIIFGCYKNKKLLSFFIFLKSLNGKYKKLRCVDHWGYINKNIILELFNKIEMEMKKEVFDFIEFPIFKNSISNKIPYLML